MSVVLSTIGVLLLGYGLLCLFYFVMQERFIFVRFRMPQEQRFRFNLAFEERRMRTEDGAELHALYFKADDPRGVVLYFHGNSGSLRRWGKRAPRFTSQDHDVLMPDYRGYGKSRGQLSEAALLDDAERWYHHLRRQWSQDRIVLYGRSLGSAMAIPVAANNQPRALVLESPFDNLITVARNYLPILPYRFLLRFPFHNDKVIQQVKCPTYIFHGRRDTVVPFTSALRLYALIPPDVEREMIEFPRGNHNNLYNHPRFKRKLRWIFQRAKGEPSPTFAPAS